MQLLIDKTKSTDMFSRRFSIITTNETKDNDIARLAPQIPRNNSICKTKWWDENVQEVDEVVSNLINAIANQMTLLENYEVAIDFNMLEDELYEYIYKYSYKHRHLRT